MAEPGGEDLDLRGLILLFWRGKWIVLALLLLCTAVAVVATRVAPKQYTARVVVSPVTDTQGGGLAGRLGGLASQFGGLASLAGLSMSSTDTGRTESLATLQSERLTTAYIAKNNLLPILFSDRWNATAGAWKPGARVPTLWEANRFFATKVRSVQTDSKTGLVTVAVEWSDAKVAAKWANDLVETTNMYLRDQAVEETGRNIAYLKDQAARTEVIGIRQAIGSILESELNRAMLARGNEYYALKVIDEAVPPEKPSSPKLLLWIFMGFFVGAALSVLWILLRQLLRPVRR